MSALHVMASGMGGIRTAGDPVAMMQIASKVRLPEAKRYMTGKLGVVVDYLSNEVVMRGVRKFFDSGSSPLFPAMPGGWKRISELPIKWV